MKRQVVVCDFKGVLGRECRSFADETCTLCGQDGCKSHLANSFMVACLTRSERDPQKPMEPQHQEYKTADTGNICAECMALIATEDGLSERIRPYLQEAYVKIIEELKAVWAAKALSNG